MHKYCNEMCEFWNLAQTNHAQKLWLCMYAPSSNQLCKNSSANAHFMVTEFSMKKKNNNSLEHDE